MDAEWRCLGSGAIKAGCLHLAPLKELNGP